MCKERKEETNHWSGGHRYSAVIPIGRSERTFHHVVVGPDSVWRPEFEPRRGR